VNQDPLQPPSAEELVVSAAPLTLDPPRAREIAARIRRLNRASLVLGVLGLSVQVGAQVVGGPSGALLALVGTGVFVAALSLHAQMRNRSGWWGLLGVLSCLGLVILLILPKRCHHCNAVTKGQTCALCGAPAPP
jgi:hypothetical protein